MEKLAQTVGSAIGSRALFGENLGEFVPQEKNDSVSVALDLLTAKLGGLSANAQEHEPALQAAASTIGQVREKVKSAKKSTLEPVSLT